MCHYAELDIPGAFSLGVGQLYRVGMTRLLAGHSVVCRHAIPIFTGTYGKGSQYVSPRQVSQAVSSMNPFLTVANSPTCLRCH